MANVTRYDPFADVDDLFKGFFLRPVRMGMGAGDGASLGQLKVDVSEDENLHRPCRSTGSKKRRHQGLPRRQCRLDQRRSKEDSRTEGGREGHTQRALLRHGIAQLLAGIGRRGRTVRSELQGRCARTRPAEEVRRPQPSDQHQLNSRCPAILASPDIASTLVPA